LFCKVLGGARYLAVQGSIWGKVLGGTRLAILPDTIFTILLKKYANISKKSIRIMPKAKKRKKSIKNGGEKPIQQVKK